MKGSQQRTPKADIAAPRTADEARQHLEQQGISVADFARSIELPYSTVYQVITGQKKGRRGDAHRAAVALGMKIGTIVTAEAGNA